jgi:hypothetical protein
MGIPSWLLAQRSHSQRLEESRGKPLPSVTEVDAEELETLRGEHRNFKHALIMIASGGDASLARDALGEFDHPDSLRQRIAELEDENATLQAALEAARDG